MKAKAIRIYSFLRKAYTDMRIPLIYKANTSDNKLNCLQKYYFEFDYHQLMNGGSYNFMFDESGIPIVKGHISDTDGNYFYNPQAIGQLGLAMYHEYLETKDKKWLDRFIGVSNWFVNSYVIEKGVLHWPSNEKKIHNVYGEDKVQKISSMSQSRGISILLRAYQITGDSKYIEIVEQAIKAYKTSITDGGFLVKKHEMIYFEEPGQPRILNHMIFTMFGLYDYCRVKKFDTEYYDVFNDSVSSLKELIPKYDCGWWSLYDDFNDDGKRRFNPCTRHYHNIHIKQLDVIYQITGDSMFMDYMARWTEYDRKIFNRLRMLFNKAITVIKMKRL